MTRGNDVVIDLAESRRTASKGLFLEAIGASRRPLALVWFMIGMLLLAGASPVSTVAGQSAPHPPAQPAAGPGGSATPFRRVVHQRIGTSPTGGWLFLPVDDRGETPAAKPLPLVLFFHGYTALSPTSYLSWINHLALNGALVFYPDYQDENFPIQNPDNYLPQALSGVRMLMEQMGTGGVPLIDTGRVTAVGHSLGGVLAANYAAIASSVGLPVPSVLMPVVPGGCSGCGDTGDRLGAPLRDLGSIAATMRVLVVTAEDDTVVANGAAKLIWAGIDQIPLDQRDFVTFRSDTHGQPPLIADHLMAQTAGNLGELDTLDFFGLWKLLDGLMACTFDGDLCDVALGGTGAQRSLGSWSDGVLVTPLLVTDHPA